MMYRAYAIYNHFEQLKNQYKPYKMYMKKALEHHMQDIRNNIHSQAEIESRHVNLYRELVTGLTRNREGETLYYTVPIVATVYFATALSGFVAGNN